jgi:hypothetical protein
MSEYRETLKREANKSYSDRIAVLTINFTLLALVLWLTVELGETFAVSYFMIRLAMAVGALIANPSKARR